MKKLVLLGGSRQQIPAIEYANKKGFKTILCDYLPDNPGQQYADKFYCVSTTNKEEVLNVANREKADAVVAYASDPAALTAAYVAEKMDLPTNPFESVKILSRKDKFREFLTNNNFNCPRSRVFQQKALLVKEAKEFNFPLMIKPVDSSGSKGVSKVLTIKELSNAFDKAILNSRSKRVICEEFIDQDHPYMIAGDCFVFDGKVEYWGLLNSHRNKSSNPFVPIGTSYPVYLTDKRLKIIKKEVKRLFKLLNIEFGAFNIEIMFDKNDNLYFIEMGPRNGGNMIPELLELATGVDTVAATVDAAIGNKINFTVKKSLDTFVATYVLNSSSKGKFGGINFKNGFERKIIKKEMYKNIGDKVEPFRGANNALGILFLKFENEDTMLSFFNNPGKWIKPIINEL